MADDILSQVSMERLAQRLGTDEASAREAAEAAMPTLLAGMTKEADDPDRRPALASALREDHDPQLLEDEDPFERIDPNEGDKIVNHVFGPQRGQVESDLQGFLGGGSGGLVGKLLPMLAPLVMSYLSRRMTGGGGFGGRGGGGGLGDILGSVLGGGGTPQQRPAPSGGGMGDVLGSVFGGQAPVEQPPGTLSSGGGLGDVLGQLGGSAGRGGGLDDLLGSILQGRR